MNELEALKTALIQIGNLPLEFNTRARAIAQRAINKLGECEWRIPLTDEEIYKTVDRGRTFKMPPLEEKIVSTETKEQQTETYQPPEIEMIPVESSNIESVGHDGAETLRVQFKSSGAYDYRGITETEFIDLVNAESVGKAYNALTRGKGIKGIKLA